MHDGTPIVLEELGKDIAARLASVGIDPASESTDGKKTVTTYEVRINHCTENCGYRDSSKSNN